MESQTYFNIGIAISGVNPEWTIRETGNMKHTRDMTCKTEYLQKTNDLTKVAERFLFLVHLYEIGNRTHNSTSDIH
jgi:hypothetical protein